MTNLTRLRLILVDSSGLMKKRTHLKQNILFFNAGRLRNSSWCKCGECSEMPTETVECVCCREMKNIEKMIESKFYTTEGIFIGDICDIL